MNNYLTDKQVAAIMEVSPSTITRIMNGAFGGKDVQPLRRVKCVSVGKGRRWDAQSLAEVLGKSVEDLLA